MPLRKIITVPEPVLRRRAHKVADFGPDLQILIDDMVETMRAAPGVGLAAPQVNVSQRVIVVEFGDEEDEQTPARLYTVVNPEIVRPSQETEKGTEACLSIPGFLGEVERVASLTVKGQNRHGQPIRIKAKGWLARIFQHEIDHLDGVLFTDRALWVRKIEDGEDVPLD
jgi:peptide deformylase